VRHSGCGVVVAKTTKNMKRLVVGMRGEVWGGRANGFVGEAIKDMSDVMKSFDPKRGGKPS
jgi:streptogramin lyase